MKPKLNVRLLRRIQKHITEEPRRFFMAGVQFKAATDAEWINNRWDDIADTRPPCGTAACIAGWAINLSGKSTPNIMPTAAHVLGTNPNDCDRLFVVQYWPAPFADRYPKAKTPKQRAKIACQRIDHLIKTGE